MSLGVINHILSLHPVHNGVSAFSSDSRTHRTLCFVDCSLLQHKFVYCKNPELSSNKATDASSSSNKSLQTLMSGYICFAEL